MKKTLYVKFLFIYLIFAMLCFVTVTAFTSHFTSKTTEENKADELYKEAATIASRYSIEYRNRESDYMKIAETLGTLGDYLSAQVWIMDQKGTVIMNSTEPQTSIQVIPDFDPVTTNGHHYRIGNFYEQFREDMLSVIYPIPGDFKIIGYVVIHTPMSQLILQQNELLLIFYLTAGIIFLLSLLILAGFTYLVYIPLKKITKAANEYAEGNLTYNLPISTDDEIGYLAASLNYMSNELSTLDDYQKKFISNISHDFRSPLTSIKGYLEAVLDGTIPPELQEKYLNIVLFETERLNKLTSSLLTLNDFNRNRSYLDITSFDVNVIIKKTAAMFEGICTPKKIVLDLLLAGPQLYVNADMGKIQQVLYNLMDNAIKFSHGNSEIIVETTEKNDKIFISVKDTGIGIPKDSMKKIWERFYKTDLSRGKDKKGSGLGLAIVKEAIQAHGENIDVISTEGVGTEFIFSLSKGKKGPEPAESEIKSGI